MLVTVRSSTSGGTTVTLSGSFKRGIMTKSYIAARETILRARGSVVRMVHDENGVVSFEYLIVAACIIAAVGLAFGGTGAGTIKGALSSGISTIATSLTTTLAT